ncbi:MAG: M4 family metallopeptidase, partial [Marmoricola sp.]
AGRHLYDPAVVHEDDPMGARPVWQFEVTNGSDVRETVLIGTGRGEVALHFNDAPGINRRVCDNAQLRTVSSSQSVPVCSAPARIEGMPASVVSAEINQAYDNLGATSDAYDQLAGIDLTALIGATVTGTKYLQSTVRWCFSDDCPFQNAFWDGNQMVFGTGWAAADDVVGHELTHGYVERTAGLFALHQSGAINESVSDTIGEIVDHRNPLSSQSDTDWKVGEDLPVLALRSMKNPPLYDQPDRMTSDLFDDGDLSDDNGAVHVNDGVGNKTAYLISQGGSFNGQAITGIDTGDALLAKTGRLYLETIPRLTSGAQYADLGRVLASTCDELVASSTAGFMGADCVAVRAAVLATELAKKPKAGAANAEAPAGCSTDARQVELLRDDEAQQDFDFVDQLHWQRTPDNDTPVYARSGDSSWFGWDPDESDPAQVSSLISGQFTVPSSAGQSTYLHFNHAYVFAWADAQSGQTAWYPDGGQVLVQTLSGGTWTTRSLPWVNGPTKSLDDTATKAFGGDSHGYGSSRLDLTPIAGQTARVVFKVSGNYGLLAGIGWWIDDIRLFSCVASASAPATTVAAGTTSALVSWTPPTFVDSSPVASYRITRSDGSATTAPASARSVTLTGLNPASNVTVSVAAVTEDGHVGAASSVPIYATTTATSAVAKIKKNTYFNITGTVTRRGTTTKVPGIKVTLQRHLQGRTTWVTVTSGTTNSVGAKAFRVRQSALTYYRVVTTGMKNWLGSTSATRTVGLR